MKMAKITPITGKENKGKTQEVDYAEIYCYLNQEYVA